MTATAATERPAAGTSRTTSIVNDAFVRAVFYQLLTAAILVGGIWYLVSNTIENLSQRGMAAGVLAAQRRQVRLERVRLQQFRDDELLQTGAAHVAPLPRQ